MPAVAPRCRGDVVGHHRVQRSAGGGPARALKAAASLSQVRLARTGRDGPHASGADRPARSFCALQRTTAPTIEHRLKLRARRTGGVLEPMLPLPSRCCSEVASREASGVHRKRGRESADQPVRCEPDGHSASAVGRPSWPEQLHLGRPGTRAPVPLQTRSRGVGETRHGIFTLSGDAAGGQFAVAFKRPLASRGCPLLTVYTGN